MKIAAKARELARSLLESELPVRWAHTRGVAAQALALRRLVPTHADLLAAATWLHDISYASPLAATGFHPLDGARYLRDTRFDDLTVGERITEILSRYDREDVVHRAITQATPILRPSRQSGMRGAQLGSASRLWAGGGSARWGRRAARQRGR